MQLSLYNTSSRKREIFRPIDKNLIKMYVCGPTVYDHPHIGNARSSVVYDVLYRILIQAFGQEKVRYVRNITDVDDKIIDRARELDIKIDDLTTKTTADFHLDMQYLNCLPPTIEPKALEHIPEMIQITQKLLEGGYAYIAEGHVYFDITKAKDYTALSHRSLEEMIHSVRIEHSEGKKHPGDFVLWKPTELYSKLAPGEQLPPGVEFESPWGWGRPGWHIECSAMSHKYLGENFDIHGGGADLIFPHHTNEIAQSTSAFPGSNFANYWVHNGFLTVGGEKMSKSLGNFVTVKDLRDKKVPGEALRLVLLTTHYRKPLDYNDKALSDAVKTLNYWYRALDGLDLSEPMEELPEDFIAPLLEDLNTPLALTKINELTKLVHSAVTPEEKKIYAKALLSGARFLGLLMLSPEQWFGSSAGGATIDDLIAQRAAAKKDKNWALADQIRAQLLEQGIVLEDKPGGETIWRRERS